ncbi:hypothetical protein Tco_0316120 [Tanacetum coccineum]
MVDLISCVIDLRSNTPRTSYSVVAHFGGVTDWYQSQGYREPDFPCLQTTLHPLLPIRLYAATPIPPTNPTYDQTSLGHRAAMIRIRDDIPKEDMPPQRRFVLTDPPPGCDVAEISVAAAARAPRGQYDFVDAVEAGQAVRMLVRRQESEIFYTQLHDVRTDRRDIRLEIDVVRDQRTAYETELHEVRQAYLSSEAQNRALLARLETLETHMSRMEWQRQRAEDDAVRQIMRTQVLEARARIDTVEDTGSSC